MMNIAHGITDNEVWEANYHEIRSELLMRPVVDTGHWQALRNVPHTKSLELQNVVLDFRVQPTSGSWAAMIRPNLPWAEDHFKERVAGEPTNPGEEYKNWPWYAGGVEDHKESGQFSHTYQERYWPKWARGGRPAWGVNGQLPLRGIMFDYGDLNDLVSVLERDPYTRQAFLPVWFPEDLTASLADERVPCSIGYHFMLRGDKLHCTYLIRSCDFVRYLRDDIYMTGRLVQWVIQQLMNTDDPESEESIWHYVTPGSLMMIIPSLHCFEGDIPKLKREQEEYSNK